MRFMMNDVLTVEENAQHNLVTYHLKPMKVAYANVIKSFVPDYEGDPTEFGPDAHIY